MDDVKIDDPSVAGVQLRNSKDLCGFAKCRKPLEGKGNLSGYAGLVCDECIKGIEEFCEFNRKEIMRDLDQEIFDAIERKLK